MHLMFLFLSMFIIFGDKHVIGFTAGPLMEEFNLNPSLWEVVGSSFFTNAANLVLAKQMGAVLYH